MNLEHYALHHVKRARARLHWLHAWHALCESHPTARKLDLAQQVASAWHGHPARDSLHSSLATSDSLASVRVSARGLQAWDRAYRERGFAGLIDRYGDAGDWVGISAPTAGRCAEAIAFFYALWHTNNRRTVAQCHDATLAESRRRGWTWPAGRSATAKWLDAYDDRATSCLMRDGYDAWRSRYMPYIEQGYESLSPGDLYVCDHHQFKAFARYRGRVIRPWLTAILDARTRVLVGFHVGPAPHSDSILSALRNAFERWGIPRSVKIDNGKDFDSRLLTGTTKRELRRLKRSLGSGWKDSLRHERSKVDPSTATWYGLLAELGCEVVRAIPYEPQSKVIERFFRTASDRFTRDLATYCDTSAERKPEALETVLADGAAVPELDDLAVQFARWVADWYHVQPHRGDGMAGLSPQAAWDALPSRARVAEAGALGLLVQVRGLYRVGANGVRVQIGSASLGYGQYDPNLTRWKGRDVLVAVDPADLSVALCFTPDRDRRKLICRAANNQRISPLATAEDLREAAAAINAARRDAKRARRSASTRTKTAAMVARDAARQRQREALRATGTDDARPRRVGTAHQDGAAALGTIAIVHTGFEGSALSTQDSGLRTQDSISDAADLASDAWSEAIPHARGADDDAMEDLDEFDEEEEEDEAFDEEAEADSDDFEDWDSDANFSFRDVAPATDGVGDQAEDCA